MFGVGLGWPPGRFANGVEEPACPDQGDPENDMSEQRVPASRHRKPGKEPRKPMQLDDALSLPASLSGRPVGL